MKAMLTVLVLLALAGGSYADRGDPVPNAGAMDVVGEEGVIGELPLEHTSVEIVVTGTLQRATVRQVYGNPYEDVIEAVYTFPLPEDGAVDRMDMWIGDREVRGEIHESALARSLYEAAISAGQTASLLEQERPNIFTQSVGNILPGDSIVIEISYVAPVSYDSGEWELVFPMVVGPRFVPAGEHLRRIFGGEEVRTSVEDADRITPPVVPEGTRAGYDIDLRVTIRAGMLLRDYEVLNHEVDVDLDWRGTAEISLRNEEEIPNRDFVLRYRTAGDEIEAGVLATNGALGGHFMLILQPDAAVPEEEITPKEMFFVVDCSGSMSGQPMEVAKAAVRRFVAGMNPEDTFQIMRFSETASAMSRSPLRNTPENVRTGIGYIDALSGEGGTMMIEGIRAAIGYPEDPDRMRYVIFLTDGFIGNEAEILGELRSTLGEDTRLFSVGVGSSPNRYLIEGLAEEGRGHAYYVGLEEDPSEAVESIYGKINDPYLVGIDIDWGDLEVFDVYPSRIPDLYAGEPLVLVGRYSGSGSETVRITGRVAGRTWEEELSVSLPSHEEGNDVVATLWARNRIHELSRRMYDSYGYAEYDEEIVEEITDTALDYQIMSDYTSFVAVCEEVRTDPDGNPVRVQVPVNMPDGVSYEGVFGTEMQEHAAYRSTMPAGPVSTGSTGWGGGGGLLVTANQTCCEMDGEFYDDVSWTPEWYGTVSLASASPTLGLLPSEVRGAVREVLDAVEEAYAAFLAEIESADAWPVGLVSFAVEVDGSGNVTSASVAGEGLDPDLDAEICAILEGMRLPAPPDGGGTIVVQLSFQKTY